MKLCGNSSFLPLATFAVGIHEHSDFRVHDVRIGDNDLRFAIAIEIRHRCAHTNAIRALPAHGDILMRNPFAPSAIFVLKPGVGTNNIKVAVAIDISDPAGSNCAVNRRPDRMPLPRLPGIRWDGIPI
jgi:hypothetical protein